MKRTIARLASLLLLAGFLLAQNLSDKSPVIMAPVGNVQVHAGASKDIPLDFRVESEFQTRRSKGIGSLPLR